MDLLDNLLHASGQQHPPPIDDSHIGTQLRQICQEMRTQQDRHSLLIQLPYRLPEFQTGSRIQPCGRFVHHQQHRLMQQCPRQAQPLLHPPRKSVHIKIQLISKPHLFQKGLGTFPCRESFHAITRREKFHIFRYLQIVIDSEIVRDIADLFLQPVRLRQSINTVNLHVSGIRHQQPADNLDRRRLACSVRPHKPVQSSFLNLHIQSVQGMVIPIQLAQIPYLQHYRSLPATIGIGS